MSINGSCQCGNITYTISSDPLATYACHCMSCQKRTGSAFSMGMFLPLAALKLTGTLVSWERTSARGIQQTRYSCAACGNIIYGIGSDMPEIIKLQPGTLDNTSGLHAEVHLWTQSAQRWFVFQPHATTYATQPDDAATFLAAAQHYREHTEGNKL